MKPDEAKKAIREHQRYKENGVAVKIRNLLNVLQHLKMMDGFRKSIEHLLRKDDIKEAILYIR